MSYLRAESTVHSLLMYSRYRTVGVVRDLRAHSVVTFTKLLQLAYQLLRAFHLIGCK